MNKCRFHLGPKLKPYRFHRQYPPPDTIFRIRSLISSCPPSRRRAAWLFSVRFPNMPAVLASMSRLPFPRMTRVPECMRIPAPSDRIQLPLPSFNSMVKSLLYQLPGGGLRVFHDCVFHDCVFYNRIVQCQRIAVPGISQSPSVSLHHFSTSRKLHFPFISQVKSCQRHLLPGLGQPKSGCQIYACAGYGSAEYNDKNNEHNSPYRPAHKSSPRTHYPYIYFLLLQFRLFYHKVIHFSITCDIIGEKCGY
mgnify:CR=1 FL=1